MALAVPEKTASAGGLARQATFATNGLVPVHARICHQFHGTYQTSGHKASEEMRFRDPAPVPSGPGGCPPQGNLADGPAGRPGHALRPEGMEGGFAPAGEDFPGGPGDEGGFHEAIFP